jgi:hypothetical protein
MARGWESKAVEAQMEDRAEQQPREAVAAPELSTGQMEAQRRRENLLLSRAKIQQDLAACENPRYKQLLSAALSHLDRQLATMDID